MKRKIRAAYLIGLILGVTIAAHYLGWLKPIENFFHAIFDPAAKTVFFVRSSLRDDTREFESIGECQTAFAVLREQSDDWQIDQTKTALLQEENDELRSQLNYLKIKNFESVGAQVVGKNIDPLASAILIDRGEEDGVKIGDAVIVREGILIGLVAKVEKQISTVRLINDNQSKIAATVMNETRSLGLVEGGYGISVQMNFIPQVENININDTVITSGLSSQIPYGLIIGTVEAVEKEAYQPFQKAALKPFADLDHLILVTVVIGQKAD